MQHKYWNKKLKQWWDHQDIVEENGKIYQAYVRNGRTYGIDVTGLIEVRGQIT